MKRLQTYFSLLALLLVVASGAIAITLTKIPMHPFLRIWIFILGATFIFALALMIGHFIAEPLKNLHLHILHSLETGEVIEADQNSTLTEANVLANDFHELSKNITSTSSNLYVQQKRETSFINDIAHELRTPLTAIQGSAEALLDDDMPSEMRQRFCNTIIRESERLTRLTNDLITLQHIEEHTDVLHMKRINIRSVALEVAESLQVLAQERDGTIVVEGEAADVLGNPDKLNQALTNLVTNAIRFIPDGGRILIQLESVADASVIKVIDNGPGFGNLDPQMLFSRFFRGDNSRARKTGGSGLGLSIVKSIVESFDGEITAFNTAEGGACFMISLPSVL